MQEDASLSDASRQEHEKVIEKLQSDLMVASEQLGGMQSDLASHIQETEAAKEATRGATERAQALQVMLSFLHGCAYAAVVLSICFITKMAARQPF